MKNGEEDATMIGYVGNIEKRTLKNNSFRQALFTAKNARLFVMCLQRGEEIGDEVHHDVDQFLFGKAHYLENVKMRFRAQCLT